MKEEKETHGLRLDKTYFPAFEEAAATTKLPKAEVDYILDNLKHGPVLASWEIDQLLEDGEGELTEEDCDHVGTDLPPGLYRHIRITDDKGKPQTLCTIYMRTVEGVLDEMWLGQAWEDMPPNPLEQVPLTPTYIPSLVGELPRKPESDREEKYSVPVLRDAKGSQGLEGRRPTLRVKFIESPDRNHIWQFPRWKVRSTTLAPVLVRLRDAGFKKVSMSLLRQAIEASRRP